MKDDCEHCAFCVYDEEWGETVCDAACAIDEDDEARIRSQEQGARCPFFRFYDEYKLVEKQN